MRRASTPPPGLQSEDPFLPCPYPLHLASLVACRKGDTSKIRARLVPDTRRISQGGCCALGPARTVASLPGSCKMRLTTGRRRRSPCPGGAPGARSGLRVRRSPRHPSSRRRAGTGRPSLNGAGGRGGRGGSGGDGTCFIMYCAATSSWPRWKPLALHRERRWMHSVAGSAGGPVPVRSAHALPPPAQHFHGHPRRARARGAGAAHLHRMMVRVSSDAHVRAAETPPPAVAPRTVAAEHPTGALTRRPCARSFRPPALHPPLYPSPLLPPLPPRPPRPPAPLRDGCPGCPAAPPSPPERRSAPRVSSRPNCPQRVQLVRGRDEACPVSTGGGTRRVQLVREGRGGSLAAPTARPRAGSAQPPSGRCRAHRAPWRRGQGARALAARAALAAGAAVLIWKSTTRLCTVGRRVGATVGGGGGGILIPRSDGSKGLDPTERLLSKKAGGRAPGSAWREARGSNSPSAPQSAS